MEYVAVEVLEEALDRAKEILMPFDLMTWTRLAVIAFFIGGSGIGGLVNMPFSSFSSFDGGSSDFGTSTSGLESSIQSNPLDQSITGLSTAFPGVPEASVLLFAGGLIFVIVLAAFYLNSLAKFVLFRGLNDNEIRIRRNIGRHYYDAFKYFIFQIGIGLLTLGFVAAWIGSLFVNPIAGVMISFVVLPFFIILAVFNGVVNDFTLLEVINSDRGLLESIRYSLSEVTEGWSEFGVYLIMRLVVGMLVGVISASTVAIISVLYLLLFGVIAALFALVSPLAAVIPAVIGLTVWLVSLMYISAPFKTFLYSYYLELYEGFMG